MIINLDRVSSVEFRGLEYSFYHDNGKTTKGTVDDLSVIQEIQDDVMKFFTSGDSKFACLRLVLN